MTQILARIEGAAVREHVDSRDSVAHVEGGLRWLKGNSAPYFSITLSSRNTGGCQHEAIRALCGDRFNQLIALQLADIDGKPFYAVENGYYWLAGYHGGMGERYHGGNSKGQHGGEYREPTRLECFEIFANLWRLTDSEAHEIARDCYSRGAGRYKERLAEHAATMAARWKAEADACIEALALEVPTVAA